MSRQLDLIDAIERRDIGIAHAQQGAGDAWTERAACYLRDFATHRTEPFLIEDAIEAFTGWQPFNRRAWGAATRIAAKRGWIRKVGYGPARTSNCSPKCMWRGQ